MLLYPATFEDFLRKIQKNQQLT